MNIVLSIVTHRRTPLTCLPCGDATVLWTTAGSFSLVSDVTTSLITTNEPSCLTRL